MDIYNPNQSPNSLSDKCSNTLAETMSDGSPWPIISIVTPSFNRAGMIETAIRSVIDQKYPRVEHIIIDGGSTDETLDVLKKYSHLRIVSEPDMGMYDALNKGLALATGEIIGFLNTDDFYAPDVFVKIAPYFSDKEVDAVAGIAGVVENPENIDQNVVFLRPGHGKELIKHTVLEQPIFNAYFFSKRVFQKTDRFETHYKIVADRNFMLRFALGHFNTTVVDYPVYYYYFHAGSMTGDYTEEKFRRIVDEHLLLSVTYLKYQTKFPRELIKSLVELRTRETIRACAHSLRKKDFNGVWFYFIEGFRYNPFWLIRFLRHAVIHSFRQRAGLPYHSP